MTGVAGLLVRPTRQACVVSSTNSNNKKIFNNLDFPLRKLCTSIYRLYANKTEDLINERKIDFARVSK